LRIGGFGAKLAPIWNEYGCAGVYIEEKKRQARGVLCTGNLKPMKGFKPFINVGNTATHFWKDEKLSPLFRTRKIERAQREQ
jgi:hypothetical protein